MLVLRQTLPTYHKHPKRHPDRRNQTNRRNQTIRLNRPDRQNLPTHHKHQKRRLDRRNQTNRRNQTIRLNRPDRQTQKKAARTDQLHVVERLRGVTGHKELRCGARGITGTDISLSTATRFYI